MMTLYEFFKEEAEIMGKYANGELIEVIRCKNCKWWSEVAEDNGKKFGECKHPSYVISDTVFINEDWYCADGERKEEEWGFAGTESATQR